MIDFDAVLKIPGWTTPTELYWLTVQAAQRRDVVEVGSFLGRSTGALIDCQGYICAVDIWEGEFVFEQFQKYLANYLKGGKLKVLRMPSVEAAQKIASNGKADMIFIDGAHDYESVKRDIIEWSKALRPGGLLCGHDFDNNTDPGVKQAVEELIPNYQRVPTTSIWYMPPQQ